MPARRAEVPAQVPSPARDRNARIDRASSDGRPSPATRGAPEEADGRYERLPGWWQRVAASTVACAATGALAFATQWVGASVDLVILIAVGAILGASLSSRMAVWEPAAAAAASWLILWWPGTVLPGATADVALALGASVATAAVSDRQRRHRMNGQLAAANQTLRAANEAQQEASEVAEAVLAATQDISASLDANEVAIRVAKNAYTVTQGVAGAVLLWDGEREVFRIAAVTAAGNSAEVQQLEIGARGAAPLRVALDEGIADIPSAELRDPVLEVLMRRWKASAVLAARLQRGDRLLGVVLTARQSKAPALPKERRILRGIALQAATVLESANLVNDLRTASNLKEEFMATMSHELRTPLNVIIGYTDLQVDGAFGELSPDHLDTLNRMREQALQLLDLIQATLDVGRLERGLMTVDLREVSVQEVIKETFAAIPRSWRKPGVDLGWRVDADVPTIRSDRGKLLVILRNLVHNALKFTEAGQVMVSVTADPKGGSIHLVVQDSGVGIAAQDLDVIFEMFRQSSDRKPTIGGVGLGLYIVKRLVGLLGGKIDVRSAPGRGATFRVHLPTGGPHTAPPRSAAR